MNTIENPLKETIKVCGGMVAMVTGTLALFMVLV